MKCVAAAFTKRGIRHETLSSPSSALWKQRQPLFLKTRWLNSSRDRFFSEILSLQKTHTDTQTHTHARYTQTGFHRQNAASSQRFLGLRGGKTSSTINSFYKHVFRLLVEEDNGFFNGIQAGQISCCAAELGDGEFISA